MTSKKRTSASVFLDAADTVEWGTPPEFFNAMNREFHFTLDAAASDTNHKCDKYYTNKQDAIHKKWRGRVWINPPYGRELKHWMKKATHEIAKERTEVIVFLVPVRSSTQWWHNIVMRHAEEIRFVNGGLAFHNFKHGYDGGAAPKPAPYPLCIIVFRKHLGPPIYRSCTKHGIIINPNTCNSSVKLKTGSHK
jgi:phage N-6-adenine-methyltransferase